MKIILAGGSGFIGNYLTRRFREEGHEVQTISRNNGDISWNTIEISSALDGADVLINLAGHTINCRHTKANREAILQSRLSTTAMLGDALKMTDKPPALWINASASAIYDSNIDKPAGESTITTTRTFLSNVVSQWENCFFSFHFPETRQVALRTSVVLGEGGAFSPLYLLTRFGLGGATGSGKQFFSWIHIEDYFQVVKFAIANKEIQNVLNCCSEQPITNRELMKALRKAVGISFGLPAPSLAVKIGAFIIGTESSLLLESSYMFPENLNKVGFVFKYPDIFSASSHLVTKFRKRD